MTLLDAAKKALEEMQRVNVGVFEGELDEAITALRQAIEQAQQYVMENAQGELERISLVQTGVGIGKPEQEPVAWVKRGKLSVIRGDAINLDDTSIPLYAAPPQRKPLTDEEIDRVTDQQWASNNHKPIYAAHRAYARAIERAHGIGGGE